MFRCRNNILLLAGFVLTALCTLVGTGVALAAPPAANLDQLRNENYLTPLDPAAWVNGNVGFQTGHYIEGYSIAYRARLTDLPVGDTIRLILGYDIKHSDKHAIDYLTYYDRINDPLHSLVFGHSPELIDPLIGVAGVSATTTTFPIEAPSVNVLVDADAGGPNPAQLMPLFSFNNLSGAEKVMTLFGGTILDVQYDTSGTDPEGVLADAQSEARVEVTLIADGSTAVLAWGGHIATRNEWGFPGDPQSAGGISGSPYHMRLLEWNLNNLGQQDRSLSAVAVFTPCGECSIAGNDPVCPGSTNVYTSTITGTCDNPAHNWSVTGNAVIVGSNTGSSVTVLASNACGSFTLTDSVGCEGCTGSPLVCTKTVQVVDTTAPVLSGCPSDASFQCYSQLPPPAVVTANDDCAGVVPVGFNESQSNPGSSCNNIITRTWTAVDDCGNTATCTQTITIDDNTAPVVTFCPPGGTIPCDQSPVFGTPTATDNCDPTPELVLVGTFASPGDCPQESSYTRRWVFRDDCGNVSDTCSQTFTKVDNVAPVISGVGANDTIDCPATPQFSNPTVSDNCDPIPSLTFDDDTISGSCPVAITRTWTATDACGNSSNASQTIWVVDNTAPAITFCPPGATIPCNQSPVFGTPTASDACDASPELVLVGTFASPGDCPQESSYTRRWVFRDDCGNVSDTCSQTITKQDNVAPTITFCPPSGNIPCDQSLVFGTPTATDNCDPTPELILVGTFGSAGDCPQESSYTRKWVFRDDCGNVSDTCSQTITKVDDVPPVITFCPPGGTIPCDQSPVFGTPTGTDNCDPTPELILVGTFGSAGDCPQESSYTRKWVFRDDCGNVSDTCSQTITKQDNVNPVISGVGANDTIDCPATPQFSNPTASDNCDPLPSLTFDDDTLSGSCPLAITRTWTATDACGNDTTASQTIWVVDNTAPAITFCPPSGTIPCDQNPVFGTPTASDACDASPELVLVGTFASPGDCPQESCYTRKWVYRDDCGNVSDTCSQTICKVDNTLPSITCVSDKNIGCQETPIFDPPNATDNCDPTPTIIIISTDTTQSGGFTIYTRCWVAQDDCNNTSDTCCQNILQEPCGGSQLTPTNVSCDSFLNGAADLTEVCYGVKKNVINNTAPGVFFYWTQVTAPSSNFTVNIVQTNDNASFPYFQVHTGDSEVRLWNSDCDKIAEGTQSDGQATINVTGATPGALYVISVKYTTSSLVGTFAFGTPTVHYDFSTWVNGVKVDQDVDGIDLRNCVGSLIAEREGGTSPFELDANYPNPFNATTSIRYSVPQTGKVELAVFNILGQKVRTLVDEELSAGEHTVIWDGRNQSGQYVATGVYFYRLQVGTEVFVRRMTLLK
ncbi:MAG: hypothetical protein A2Z27_05995 [candidate division Zixibacteria bacterium RBG_16_50_21]|nr:MAG: hypothetical protein A2Z27_05995 [candidate division Zixibacteria bacterium RBG_16_50_21]